MTDKEFLALFENCTLPKQLLNHRGHLKVCWLYLHQYDLADAQTAICQGIIKFAKSLGASHIYNETLTQTWIFLVAEAIQQHDDDDDNFEAFIARHDYLLNKDLPKQYYSENLLSSDLAKTGFVKPDLKPLPTQ